MENSTQALLMAAGVLVGVLIISIGVYLFSTYAGVSKDTYDRMESAKIDQFNTQFLKYYGTRVTEYKDSSGNIKEESIPVLCTAHDIISLANLAKQNNIQWEVENLEQYDPNTYYIQIDIVKTENINSYSEKNLEKWSDSKKVEFIKENATAPVEITDEAGNTKYEEQIKYYYCPTYPEISNITKRVCNMKFAEYKPEH